VAKLGDDEAVIDDAGGGQQDKSMRENGDILLFRCFNQSPPHENGVHQIIHASDQEK
jgi:hypothetical protein